jgi:hypothetical protein
MALGYPISESNPPFSNLGAGSVMLGTFLVPVLEQAWEQEINFLRFATPVVPADGQRPLSHMGKGETFRYSMVVPLAITGAQTTTGTRTPTGTAAIIQNNVTVGFFGEGMNLEDVQLRLTNESFNPDSPQGSYQAITAAASLSNWMTATADYAFGSALLASTRYISFNGTLGSDVKIGTAMAGTSYMTQAGLLALSGKLRTLPIRPRPELGNTYAIVGPAGAFDHLKVLDGFQDNAARLIIPDFFRTGLMGAWQGFSFFELMGPSANALMALAAANAVGTCLLLADACAIHDDSIDTRIGNGADNSGLSTFSWYNDYGQDGGRVKRLQVNYRAVDALAVANGNTDYSRVFNLLSYQG